MSFDVCLAVDTGGPYLARVENLGDLTYNLGPMLFEALGRNYASLDGEKAGAMLESLVRAIQAMKADPARFRRLNPPNGWGDYEAALAHLESLARACERHPKALLHIR